MRPARHPKTKYEVKRNIYLEQGRDKRTWGRSSSRNGGRKRTRILRKMKLGGVGGAVLGKKKGLRLSM